MPKLKFEFVIKVKGEFELDEDDVARFKKLEAEGEEILSIDSLKKECADMFDVEAEDVEVLEHSEIIVEGIGE